MLTKRQICVKKRRGKHSNKKSRSIFGKWLMIIFVLGNVSAGEDYDCMDFRDIGFNDYEGNF